MTINAQISNSKIIVNVENISSDKGQIIVSLHNSEKNFPKVAIKKSIQKLKMGSQILYF